MKNRYAICYNPEIKSAPDIVEKLKNILRSHGIEHSVFTTDNLGRRFRFHCCYWWGWHYFKSSTILFKI